MNNAKTEKILRGLDKTYGMYLTYKSVEKSHKKHILLECLTVSILKFLEI